MTKTLILQLKYGGLGDHLFYSHIPRIAKETGVYDKVLISNKSEFRSNDYRHIIWELNPHIDGFTDEEGQYVTDAKPQNDNENLLDRIMLGLGLDDGKRFHEPEIYYKPLILPDLADAIVYDPNYLSNAGFVNSKKVSRYFREKNIKVDLQLVQRERYIPTLPFGKFLRTKSIYDFMDVIASAKEVYSLVTGTPTLAAALGRRVHVFYTPEMPPEFRHSKNNDYIPL